MACPWFCPTRPLEDGRWAVPPRVPLIEPWEGECRARSEAITPDGQTIRKSCNSGYARGSCEHFVEGRGDAVRFHVQTSADGALRILYSYERECWPIDHGAVEYHVGTQRAACDDALLQAQVEAFAQAWRRRAGAQA